ncbi:MAG: RNA methyltransferase [Spirochaetaceae bacterium]|nr:RNA methyltransferase [Spirochaetaceae bacterium]
MTGTGGRCGAEDLLSFAALRERDLAREGLVLAEGRLLAERLLAAAGFEPVGVLCVPALAPRFEALAAGRCPVRVLPEGELAAVAGYAFHRGVLAAARRPASPGLAGILAPAGPRRLVLLPAAADPENLGSVARSAAALGFDGLLLGPESCDLLSRRASRVSMGAAFTLPSARLAGPDDLGALSAAGFSLAAAALGGGDLADWRPPARLCLLVGNEYEGLGSEWLPPVVERLGIPMAPGVDSLNAAVAAALFMYEAARPRRA